MQCEHCKYYRPTPAKDGKDYSEDAGTCHLNPPVALFTPYGSYQDGSDGFSYREEQVSWKFPRVHSDWWCSSFVFYLHNR